MRTTSLKTIYITEKELKQALASWIELEHKDTELAVHLEENECELSWSQDRKEFIISMDGEFIDNVICDSHEQNNDCYVSKVQEMPSGKLFIELPQKLIDQLGWKAGDDVEWNETEICEGWGAHTGITLSRVIRGAYSDESR